MTKKRIAIGIVVVIFLLFGGLYAYSEFERTENIKKTTTAYENSGEDLIKNELDLYYIIYNKYPNSIEKLMEGLSDERNYKLLKRERYDRTLLKNVIKDLEGFTYSVRGDDQAYKFTYKHKYGEQKVVEGNYQKDFH